MIHALADRYRFRVFTTCTDRGLPTASVVEGTPVNRVYVDVSRGWTKLLAAVRTAWFFLSARNSFDIVHLHGFSQKSVLIVLLATALRKRVVLTIHTAGSDEPAGVRQLGRLAYWAYRRADLFLAISSRIAHNYLAAGLPKTRLRQAANGLDVARFHPPSGAERREARAQLGLADELSWILFVGFFSPEKGPELLFDAWLRMRDSVPPTGVLFVGETDAQYHEVDKGIATRIRERAAELGLEGRIRFTGAMPDVTAAYRAADVFAMPSSREAFGMVLVEAMASGLPVVASRIDGVTDEIVADGSTGHLVPPGDADALAAVLASLLRNPGAARLLGRHAREAVAGRYGLAAARERWIEAYDALR
jgi:glycosyltransferase involved in cell wall biosynthesis